MKVINPLFISNWAYKDFISTIISIQLIVLGTIGLDTIGYQVPILRQLVCFIYLTFIPGIIILKLLKLYQLNSTEVILYTIGLSIFVLYFVGFLTNMVYHLFGADKILSSKTLIINITILLILLCVLCYIRDKEHLNQGVISYIETKSLFSIPILLSCLLPFLSIIGTYLVNYFHSNVILMLMLFFIAIIILFICFYPDSVSFKFYPLIIWTIAISLIWSNTLITPYINVGDVVGEYYYTNLVIKNSFWNWTVFDNYNSVLSNVVLAPFYYYICSIELVWIFKIIYPFLFSFTSIGIYNLFINEIKNAKIALLSTILFMSVSPFFNQVPFITKQSVGEIFLLLLLMVLLNDHLKGYLKSILTIIFSISLITSHYGISYLTMFLFFFVYLYLLMLKNNKIIMIFKSLKIDISNDIHSNSNKLVSLNFIILYAIIAFSWYIYISGSSVLHTLSYIGTHVLKTIVIDFMNPESSRGLYMIVRDEKSSLRTLSKILYLITQFFILIGFFKTLTNKGRPKINALYLGVSVYFLMILFFAVAISGFSVMDPRRLYHISLFVLAPFCIIGGFAFSDTISKIFNISWSSQKAINLLCTFITIFLLLNTGFIFEIANDPSSLSLSQETVKEYGNMEIKGIFYTKYVVTENVFSGKWLGSHIKNNTFVYRGDLVQGYPSLTVYGDINQKYIKSFDDTTKKLDSGYVQLSYLNILYDIGSCWYNPLQKMTSYKFSSLNKLIVDKNKIYTNGNSEILWS